MATTVAASAISTVATVAAKVASRTSGSSPMGVSSVPTKFHCEREP